MQKILFVVGCMIVVVSIVSGLVALWWWALHGMDPDVVVAAQVSVVVGMFVGGTVAAFASLD